MWIAPAVAVVTGALVLAADSCGTAGRGAVPAAVARRRPCSRGGSAVRIVPRVAKLAPRQIDFLRKLARRTWAYLRDVRRAPKITGCRPTTIRKFPSARVAHRTSPTNMGMALLADLAAYDFGYLPAGRLLERLTNTLRTMESLERHQGHFYNWYDTQSLQPLSPRYISSVDSGNLAGHLLTLRAGLLALPDHRFWSRGSLPGSSTLRACSSKRSAPKFPRSSPSLSAISIPPPTRRLPTAAAAYRWLAPHCRGPRGSRRAFRRPGGRRRVRGGERGARMGARAVGAMPSRQWTSSRASRRGCSTPDLEALLAKLPALAPIPTLRDARAVAAGAVPGRSSACAPPQRPTPSVASSTRWRGSSASPARARRSASRRSKRLRRSATDLARMDFGFLYDRTRHLFAVGYNVDERQRDAQLLRPARLRSALRELRRDRAGPGAAGELVRAGAPADVTVGDRPILLSWSGSMFEYLMPLLVMPTYENTLLDADVPRRRGAADRAWQEARRPVGHVGVGLQRRRCESQLPVSRVRRPRAWPETRTRRGCRRRALRFGAGADGRARKPRASTCSASPPKGSRADSACSRRSTTRRRDCRAASRARSSARSWRITRA